jgi:hypothetical protein
VVQALECASRQAGSQVSKRVQARREESVKCPSLSKVLSTRLVGPGSRRLS